MTFVRQLKCYFCQRHRQQPTNKINISFPYKGVNTFFGIYLFIFKYFPILEYCLSNELNLCIQFFLLSQQRCIPLWFTSNAIRHHLEMCCVCVSSVYFFPLFLSLSLVYLLFFSRFVLAVVFSPTQRVCFDLANNYGLRV